MLAGVGVFDAAVGINSRFEDLAAVDRAALHVVRDGRTRAELPAAAHRRRHEQEVVLAVDGVDVGVQEARVLLQELQVAHADLIGVCHAQDGVLARRTRNGRKTAPRLSNNTPA